jgi:hypothetical protein
MWTYSGNPANSPLDELRFWLQDTDPDNELLNDEELTYLLGLWIPKTGSVIFTAAVAAEVVAAKYTGEISVSADGVSISTSDLQQRYIALAQRLRDQYKADTATSSVPITGGIMWDDNYDGTIKPLVFGIGSMDNRFAGQQDYGNYIPGFNDSWGWNASMREVAVLPDAADLLER